MTLRVLIAAAALVPACAVPMPRPVPSPRVEARVAAPAPVELPRYDAVRPGRECLAQELEVGERRRAWLRKAGRIDWTLDGAHDDEAVAEAGGEEVERWLGEVMVVERHANHLRVVWDGEGVRATFYAPQASFAELVAESTTLARENGTPFAGGAGVTVPGGTDLPQVPAGERYDVVLENRWIRARGTLPRGAIDQVYVAPSEEPRTLDSVVAATEVRDVPGGALVATLTASAAARARGPVADGVVPVEIWQDGIRVVGFVAEGDLRPHDGGELGTIGTGGGFGWGGSHIAFLFLEPGDLLFPPGGREPVAVVTRERLRVKDHGPRDDGTHAVGVFFPPWGFLDLRLDPATYRSLQAYEQARLDRVAFDRVASQPADRREEVLGTLDWHRDNVADCLDRALKGGETPATVRYRATLDLQAEKTTVTLTPGGGHPKLEACVESALENRRRDLYGTRATFVVELDVRAVKRGPAAP